MDTRRMDLIVVAMAVIAVAAGIAVFYTIDLPGDDRDEAFPEPIPDDARGHPAADAAKESYSKEISDLKNIINDPSSGRSDITDALESAFEAYIVLCDQNTWMGLDYHKDPSGNKEEYEKWTNLATTAHDDLMSALKAALSGPCSDDVEDVLRDNGLDPEEIRGYNEMTDDEKKLSEKENALVTEYDDIMGREYSVDAYGRTWTISTATDSTSLTQTQKNEVIGKIYEAQLSDASDAYAQLVDVRNDMATLQNYSDYAEYSYSEVYGRDYTPDEALSISNLIDPAFSAYQKILERGQSDRTMSVDRMDWMNGLDESGIYDAISPFIDSVDDGYSKLLDYMIDEGLITLCSDEGRMDGAYTQRILEYSSALIYNGNMDASGKWSGIDTLVHEFGHAANLCLNPDGTDCYDILEIHSQGLEALYCTSGMVGHSSSRAMATQVVSSFLNTIMLSAMLTELEVWAYQTEAESGSITGSQVCEKFSAILDAHGLTYGTPYDEGYLWAGIPHLFQSPNYYISYATSAVGAAEIFVIASTDYEEAEEMYLDLVFQQGVDGYVEAVEKAGLTDAFGHDAAKNLTKLPNALQRIDA